MREVNCDYCGKPAKCVSGKTIYAHRPDLHGLFFWLCPPCDAYVGTHKTSPDMAPLGRLANAELRKAKSAAHAAFDPLWKSGRMSRRAAYAWLSDKLGLPPEKTHIGMFDVDTCAAVVAATKEK